MGIGILIESPTKSCHLVQFVRVNGKAQLKRENS